MNNGLDTNTSFSIHSQAVSPKFDIYKLLDHFIGLPRGVINFIYGDGTEPANIQYPKNSEEVRVCTDLIDFSEEIDIRNKSLILKYFPEAHKEDKENEKCIFEIKVETYENYEILDKVCSLPKLPGFPKEFFVFRKDNGYTYEGEHFFKELGNTLYYDLVFGLF